MTQEESTKRKIYEREIQKMVEKVLVLEGGYVNNPAGPGGKTKFGISKSSYPDLDIKNLNREQTFLDHCLVIEYCKQG